MKFNIHEIFYSIQGESSYAGFPCVFIRFSGCNLRCLYCDTSPAWGEGTQLELESVLQKIGVYECRLVELTGGEPLLQENIRELTGVLIKKKYHVLIETNGTRPITDFPRNVIFIMDVKTPGSGEEGRFCTENLNYLKPDDELKFVLKNRLDYDWAKEFIFRHGLGGKVKIVFSPVWGSIDLKEYASWILGDRLTFVRLQLQLHKLIWGPDAQGV